MKRLLSFVFGLMLVAGLQAQTAKVVIENQLVAGSTIFLNGPFVATPSAPTAAAGAAGSVDVGTHTYRMSCVNFNGETIAGAKSNSLNITSAAKHVTVTIPLCVGPSVTGRNLYRTKAGVADTASANYFLVSTSPLIADNTSATYDDNIADASLTSTTPPTSDKSNGWIFKSTATCDAFDGACATAEPKLNGFGSIGVGFNTSPNMSGAYASTAGMISLKGTGGDYSAIEIATSGGDAAALIAGQIAFLSPGNTGGGSPEMRIAVIDSLTASGGTAAQRGGILRFYTKIDGSAAPGSIVERMRMTSTGVVAINESTVNARLGQLFSVSNSAGYGGAALSTWSATGGEGAILDFNKSASATIGTQTTVADTNFLGAIIFRGSDGTNFVNASGIQSFVDGAVTAGHVGGRLAFYTSSAAGSNTERMRITNLGELLIGTTTARSGSFGIDQSYLVAASTATRGISLGQYTADTSGNYLWFQKSRGDSKSSPAAVSSGDTLGTILAAGFDGTVYRSPAAIRFIADAAPVNNTSLASAITFLTGIVGAGGGTERMRITNTGNVVIGPAALATNATDGFLYVPTSAGTPTGAPTAQTGTAAVEYDTTNDVLYTYNTTWKASGGRTKSQLLTSGTSFTVPAGVTLVYVTLQAGGGAGGGGAAASSGGGSGELIYRRPWVVTGGATVAYVIGAAGTGGGGTGGSGGATTWDTAALSAAFGVGGDATTSGAGGGRLGNAGKTTGVIGAAGTLDVDTRGGSSGGGVSATAGGTDQFLGGVGVASNGGGGAGSHFGTGGAGGNAAVGATPAATAYGAGGGGTGTGTHNGGSGVAGCILVEWVAP